MTTNRAHILLWTDNASTYLDGIKAAGLADRVAVETLPRKEKPSAEQLANAEVLMEIYPQFSADEHVVMADEKEAIYREFAAQSLQLIAGAVYFCALWAYTLLPTPPARELTTCAAPQLRPFAFVGDVLRLGVGSPSELLHNPALLQVVLNVALFR